MKKELFFAILFLSTNIYAMSESEICSYRGQLVESFAISRDSGRSEKQTFEEAKKILRKVVGKNAPDIKTLVSLPYEFRHLTPAQMKYGAEQHCLSLKEDN